MQNTALVTGAGRGIGLELCRQLLGRGYTVVACPRSGASAELDALVRSNEGRAHLVLMDIADDASIAQAATRVGQLVEHLDLLINNAGVYPTDDGGLESLDLAKLALAFDVNALGALRVTRALLPLLRKGSGKRVIQMTSLMGSIGDNTSGGSYAYRMSKTALNMANRNLAHELGPEGFLCLTLHPGWVQTRMGGAAAPMALESATTQVLENALTTGLENNGGFKGPGGVDLPF